jgi:hypothetical protein
MWLTCIPAAPLVTERAEGVPLHEREERIAILDAEMRRYVERHFESLSSSAASCAGVPTLSQGPRKCSPETRPSSTWR